MKNKNWIYNIIAQTISQNLRISLGLFIVIACSIVAGIWPPLVLEKLVNSLSEGKNIDFAQVMLYFLLLALSCLLDAGKESLITVFGQKITHRIRSAMCAKLKRLPADYYTRQETGVTVARFVGDVDTVEALFASGIISMAVDVCKVVSILGVIFVKSPGLGGLLLLALPGVYAMTRLFQRRMFAAQLENRQAVGRANNHVPDTIRSIRMIHNLGKESFMQKRYDASIQDGYRAVNKVNFYDSSYSPIILTFSAVLVGVMMALSARGGWLQLAFGMSVGTAVAIISYVGKIFTPIETIGMEIQNIQAAAAGIRRIQEFLDEPEMQICQTAGASASGEDSGAAVAMRNVSFGYEEGSEILHGFSLTAAKGEHLTLAGRTGAGKSTVFKLLMGLYTPRQGEIRIFGQNPQAIPEKYRRRVFGYVEQTFHPVPGTVADQISLGDGHMTQRQIEAALELVGMLQTVRELPEGLNTAFSPRLFSQGQLQLLAVARAVAADPKLLLLDEITANLDSATEHRVLEALGAAAGNRTVISISHRLFEHSGGRLVYLNGHSDGGKGGGGL